MRPAYDLFTLPGTMMAVTVSLLCILFGYLIMAAAAPRKQSDTESNDSNVKRAVSVVDMSQSLRKEESLSTSTAPADNRVLNPIEFRKFKVLQVTKTPQIKPFHNLLPTNFHHSITYRSLSYHITPRRSASRSPTPAPWACPSASTSPSRRTSTDSESSAPTLPRLQYTHRHVFDALKVHVDVSKRGFCVFCRAISTWW